MFDLTNSNNDGYFVLRRREKDHVFLKSVITI